MTDHISDWIGAYVLDAVESDERAFIERHLQACAACGEEVEELQVIAAQLGAAAQEDPPEALRARVLDAVARVDQDDPGARRPGSRSAARYLAVVAAVLALAVVGLAGAVASLMGDRVQEPTLAELAQDMLVVPLAGEQGQGTLMARGDEAVLVVWGLDPLPADETYQAWVIDEERPAPAGVFSTGPDGTGRMSLQRPLGTADAVAVSREAAGGADEAPQGPVVLLGAVASSV